LMDFCSTVQCTRLWLIHWVCWLVPSYWQAEFRICKIFFTDPVPRILTLRIRILPIFQRLLARTFLWTPHDWSKILIKTSKFSWWPKGKSIRT
jgi:hypothetical protein